MLAAAGAAELTTLQYQNLLLQRAAAQQARQARYDCGAAIIRAFMRREHSWVLGIYWRLWSRFAYSTPSRAAAPQTSSRAGAVATSTPWRSAVLMAPSPAPHFSTPRLLSSFSHPNVPSHHRATYDGLV